MIVRRVLVVVLTIGLACISARAGELRVCVSRSALFFSLAKDKPGIEYEILKGFADRQGLQLRIRLVGFSELIPKLEKRECDVGTGQMTRTIEREKTVDFSASYFPVRVVLLQPRGQAPLEPDKLEGKRVLVSMGTAWESAVRAVPGLIAVEDRAGRNSAEQIRAGLADALATDSTMVESSLERNADMQVALFLPGQDYYGFPLPKGSPLKAALDQYLAAIKADGTYTAILNRHLDPETVELIVDSLAIAPR